MKRSVLHATSAIAVPVAVIAAAIAVPAVAGAAPSLPQRSAEQVLASIADSADVAYSGTVEQTSDLGLPDLGSAGQATGSDASAALEFLTGSHTARVFVGGRDTERVQVIDSLAERDVIRNGDDVWLYGSRKNEATHLSLPVDRALPAPTSSPAELAEKLLANLDPTTDVSVDSNARVAGRAAYQVILTPKTQDTLVGSVTLAVDAETGLPLRVVVDAAGQQDPAISVGFSDIDFSAPDPALFEFTPPPGATVTEQNVPQGSQRSDAVPEHPEPTVIGAGWSSVISVPAGADADSPLLDQLTIAVDGGRALETSLVSVLLTTDGRVFAGAVPVEALQAAAAG